MNVDTPATPTRTIFVWRANQWAGFLSQFARTLKDKYGVGTVLIQNTAIGEPSSSLFAFDRDNFTEIVELKDETHPRPVAELGDLGDLRDWAEDLERTLGRPVNDLLRTDRHFGIGYVSGAVFMRSMIGHATNYDQCLDIILRVNDRVQPLLEKYKPLAFVGSPGTMSQSTIIAMGESMGIPMRRMTPARHGKNFYWSEDWVCTPLGLREAYDRHLARLKAEGAETGETEGSEEAIELQPRPYTAELTLQSLRKGATIKNLGYLLYQDSRTEFGRLIRGQRNTYGNYYFRDRVWSHIERWFWRLKILREPFVTTKLPDDLKFIFFPLHIEPESSLFAQSQMADHQLAHIDMLAKTLPAGWFLVIKEHFAATAPRPPGFWRAIKRYPNVIVAAVLENGEAIALRSQAVATINGTLGVQAAMVGHPTITFHPEFMGLCMPHVQLATSYAELLTAVGRIRDHELPGKSVSRTAGQALAAATRDCAFALDDTGLLTGVAANSPEVQQAEVDEIARTLLDSLNFDHEGTEIRTPLASMAPDQPAS
jgi:hypothetical protein